MRRYTGQKALYEAISRSRDKANQHSILEKLRPGPSKPQVKPNQEPQPEVDSQQALEQTAEPDVQESPERQVVEMPPDPVIELPLQAEAEPEVAPEPRSEMSLPETRTDPVGKSRPAERVIHLASPAPASTWLRPRPIQLNEGRVEISVPYHVGVIVAVVLLMVVLVAYRLGQARQGGPASGAGGQGQPAVNPSGTTNLPVRTPPQNPAMPNVDRTPTNTLVAPSSAQQNIVPARVQGDNCIVLARSKTKENFDPVVKHFADYGVRVLPLPIDLIRKVLVEQGLNPAVLPSGDGYLLVTSDYFTSEDVPKMKQRIAELGKLYKGKAPSGFESFAPNYFSDAYGMKIR